jgi:hypothetical protein
VNFLKNTGIKLKEVMKNSRLTLAKTKKKRNPRKMAIKKAVMTAKNHQNCLNKFRN